MPEGISHRGNTSSSHSRKARDTAGPAEEVRRPTDHGKCRPHRCWERSRYIRHRLLPLRSWASPRETKARVHTKTCVGPYLRCPEAGNKPPLRSLLKCHFLKTSIFPHAHFLVSVVVTTCPHIALSFVACLPSPSDDGSYRNPVLLRVLRAF